VTAPAILVYDHFSRVPLAAFILTMVAFVAAMVRLALALGDTLMLRDMQRAALTDDLTDLPNRRMFASKLREMVVSAERDGGSVTTVMLDLDNFKQLNDTLGHDAGDALLRLTGPRLVRAAGTGALVARLGGDEFAILLEPNCDRADAGAMAQAVLDSFNEPLQVHGLALRLTASAGIATYPHDADGPDTLLKCADIAMYEAKRSRHGWEYYAADRDVNTRERLEMTGELAEALEGEEIEVAFQAIADTDTRRIRTAEALVRWRRPDGSLRPPSEFLEAAELAGLSRQLTRRVVKLALDNLCEWRAAGHDMSVSVNTTVADLLDEAFPGEIAVALKSRGLSGDALKIEVTESSIMVNPARVSEVLVRLRELGVRIALDDFGTGYSSFTHLRQLPVDRLKIDRSFVTTMCRTPTDAAIVYATIELAHRLNLRVIAEGVEDEATWQALLELDCDAVQGYGLNKPMQPAEFLELLNGWRYFADSQSLPTPASTASGGSIA
jgi:diguanylate cyclase (GGDEF)-like protein